jgi:hypothetical protein
VISVLNLEDMVEEDMVVADTVAGTVPLLEHLQYAAFNFLHF